MARLVRRDTRRIPPPCDVRTQLELHGCIATEARLVNDVRSCSHHDAEGARTLVRIRDLHACTQCGAAWFATTVTGAYLSAPRLCPVCGHGIGPADVLCKTHWFAVPKRLRDAVWRTFKKCRGEPEHLAAIAAAVDSVRTGDHA